MSIPSGNDKYEIRVTRLSVIPPGDAVFNETATHIEIDDEAAGEFVSIRQNFDQAAAGQIFIDVQNWEVIRAAVDHLIADCRDINFGRSVEKD